MPPRPKSMERGLTKRISSAHSHRRSKAWRIHRILICPSPLKFVSTADAGAPGPFRGYFKHLKLTVAFPPPQKKLICSEWPPRYCSEFLSHRPNRLRMKYGGIGKNTCPAVRLRLSFLSKIFIYIYVFKLLLFSFPSYSYLPVLRLAFFFFPAHSIARYPRFISSWFDDDFVWFQRWCFRRRI